MRHFIHSAAIASLVVLGPLAAGASVKDGTPAPAAEAPAPVPAPSAAPAAPLAAALEDVAGIWQGGLRQGNGRIQVTLHYVRDVAELEMQLNRWADIRSASCRYQMRAPAPQNVPALLNGSWGNPEHCPRDFTVTATRTGADTLTLRLNETAFLSEIALQASRRPFREADRRAPIAGFDVLGVAPGMSEAEADSLLVAAGYQPLPDRTRSRRGLGDMWSAQTLFYGRQPAGGEDWGDVFTLNLAAQLSGESGARRVVRVERDWRIPPDQNLSELTLITALDSKYGAAYGRNSTDRVWDRTGANLESSAARNSRCERGSLQPLRYRWARLRGEGNDTFNLYCGPIADIRIQTDSARQLADGLRIALYDPDEVWREDWLLWSAGEYPRLIASYEAVAGATGAAPEL